jgi:hypothetical protein
MRGAARPPRGAWGERPPVGEDAVRTLQKFLNRPPLFLPAIVPAGSPHPVGMIERRCRYCDQQFQPSPCHRQQAVCSAPACQHRRRADNRKQKLIADSEYRDVCRESARKWRRDHAGYWKQYRATHPHSVERNRARQRQRDQRRRLVHLANNNSALDLKSSAAAVWLLGPAASDLANNNLAQTQVFILQGPARKPPASAASCKQHLSGPETALA